MKILIAAPSYLPSRRANTIQVMKMAQAAQELGHQVCVLVPDSGEGKISDWETLSHHYGLKHPFDIDWLPVSPRFRGYDYGFRVVGYFKRWEADLLYTRFPQAAALASILQIPTVLEVHDLPGGGMGRFLFRCFLKGKGAKRLVLITRSLQEALHRLVQPLPEAPFSLVEPGGVDLTRYSNLPSPQDARIFLRSNFLPDLSISHFTVGYTGHLYAGRGVDLMLDIASQLPDYSFLLVGGDPEAINQLQFEISQRNLANVLLAGFVANADLPHFQAACDVLLMPYQATVAASSGGDIGQYLSPMKLFEYLACGRVILSSRLPVLCEVLNEHNAVLLPPRDADAWASVIRDIALEPARWEGLATRARQDAQRYTWESRVARIFRLDN